MNSTSLSVLRHGVYRTFLCVFGCLLLVTALSSCGDSGDDASEGENFEPTELDEVMPADESKFDVEWDENAEPHVADEDDIDDIEDITRTDGVYRVTSGSALLDGVAEGDVVLWPQVGFYEITSLEDDGEVVEVTTAEADLTESISNGEVSFEHALEAGDEGRAVGVVPGEDQPAESESQLRTRASALELTSGGVSHSESFGHYTVDSNIKSAGDNVELNFTVSSSNFPGDLIVTGTVKGMESRGELVVEDGETETAYLMVDNIDVDIDAELRIEEAEGEVELDPSVELKFPFHISGIPMYVSIGTQLTLRSSLGHAGAAARAKSSFHLTGSFGVGLTENGDIGAEGELSSFTPTGSELEINQVGQGGIGMDADVPKVSIAMARPEKVGGEIYGTHSIEMVGNVARELGGDEDDYCLQLDTNAGIFVGGRLKLFALPALSERTQLWGENEKAIEDGELCE